MIATPTRLHSLSYLSCRGLHLDPEMIDFQHRTFFLSEAHRVSVARAEPRDYYFYDIVTCGPSVARFRATTPRQFLQPASAMLHLLNVNTSICCIRVTRDISLSQP